MRSGTLYRVLAGLLVLIAVALAANHLGTVPAVGLAPLPRALAGLVAGVGIGVVAGCTDWVSKRRSWTPSTAQTTHHAVRDPLESII